MLLWSRCLLFSSIVFWGWRVFVATSVLFILFLDRVVDVCCYARVVCSFPRSRHGCLLLWPCCLLLSSIASCSVMHQVHQKKKADRGGLHGGRNRVESSGMKIRHKSRYDFCPIPTHSQWATPTIYYKPCSALST